jgi:hypothetical protein
MKEYTRAELLALTPAKYLAQGLLDGNGKPRRELRGEFATAASTQFKEAELSPQELAFTYEALRQLVAMNEAKSGPQFSDAVDAALETVGRMIKQPNNEGLAKWLQESAASIKRPADIDAFLAHMLAVLKQYSVIAASAPPPSSSPAGA